MKNQVKTNNVKSNNKKAPAKRNRYGLTWNQTKFIFYIVSTIKYGREQIDVLRQKSPQIAAQLDRCWLNWKYLNPYNVLDSIYYQEQTFALKDFVIKIDELLPPNPFWIERVKKIENELGIKYTGSRESNRAMSCWCHDHKKLHESDSNVRERYLMAA